MHQQPRKAQPMQAPRGHRVGHVQPKTAVLFIGKPLQLAQLGQIVHLHPRKARAFKPGQQRGHLRLGAAVLGAGQLQHRAAAQRGRQVFGLFDGQHKGAVPAPDLLRRFKPGRQFWQVPGGPRRKAGQRILLHRMGNNDTALVQQRVQRPAAQFIPHRPRQKGGHALRRVQRQAVQHKGGAAGLGKCPPHRLALVPLGGLGRVLAIDHRFVAVPVGGGQLDALRVKCHRHVHRHPRQLPPEQLPRFGHGRFGGGGVRFGAHTKHGAVIFSGEIPVREPGTGKNIPQQRRVIGQPVPRCPAAGGTHRRVLRRAQPPFDFYAGHPRVHQLAQMGQVIHVFQTQMAGAARLAGAQPRRGIKGQTAGPGAGAPVAAAPAQKSAHHALAAHGHAQRAVDKHLALHGRGGAHGADLFQRQFPGQNDPVIPQRRQLPCALRRVDAHLGGAVQRQRGSDFFHKLRGGKVIHNDRVRPRRRHGPHRLRQLGQLGVIHQRVQGDMHPHITGVAEPYSLRQFLRREISRRAPGVEPGQPQIHRVRPAEHGGFQHVGVARGG